MEKHPLMVIFCAVASILSVGYWTINWQTNQTYNQQKVVEIVIADEDDNSLVQKETTQHESSTRV